MVQLVRPEHPLLAIDTQCSYQDFPWLRSTAAGVLSTAAELGFPHLRRQPELIVEDLSCAAALVQFSDVIWVTSIFSAVRELRERRIVQLPFPTSAEKASDAYRLMIYSRRDRTLSPVALRLYQTFVDQAAALQTSMV